LVEAEVICKEAIEITDVYYRENGRDLLIKGFALVRLSSILLEWNEIDKALNYATEGVQLCEISGQSDVVLVAYRDLSRVLQAQGDFDGAEEVLNKGIQLARTMSSGWMEIDMAAEQALFQTKYGNPEIAYHWIDDQALSIDDQISFRLVKVYLIFARTLLKRKHFKPALKLLARLAKFTEDLGANSMLIMIYVLWAVGLKIQGNSARALLILERVLCLAETQGFIHVFLSEGEPMKALLKMAQKEGISKPYTTKLLSAFRRAEKISLANIQPVEHLSERELEVLGLIADGLSNREIAEELVVAVSTTKTHINHIYQKLEVNSRTQAIAKAQLLGLL
jgi:LuxR family maltose regulon positive regulatory protein